MLLAARSFRNLACAFCVCDAVSSDWLRICVIVKTSVGVCVANVEMRSQPELQGDCRDSFLLSFGFACIGTSLFSDYMKH